MKVTSKIKGILKEKDKGIKNGMQAMQGIMKNLHGQIMDDLGRAAVGSWDAYYLRKLLDSIEEHIAEYEDMAKKELSGQLDIMWDKGGELVKSTLIAGEMYVGFGISRSSLDVLKDYSNDYLEKLFSDAWYQIKGEINLGILGAKTPQEVAQAIGTKIDKGRFANIALRAERITQTEMGRIFSEAAQARMEEASGYVEGLEKQWIHAGHPRQPRPAHLAANGQHVPVKEPFVVGGIRMMFPRDPNAPISEVINCGCDHVPYHERWE
jgi:hypothetical protein